MSDRRELIRQHLVSERDSVQMELERELRSLISGLNEAHLSLVEAGRVNPLVLQYAASASSLIGRWNTLRGVVAMLGSKNEDE